jgi:hypothetical protein
MRKILKGRLTLAVLLSLLLLVSGTSAVVYANGAPIIDSGKDAITESHFHLSTDNYLVLNSDGQVDQDYCSITGNLMTFTHPGTPNSAAIGDWLYDNQVGPQGRGKISGSFSINVGWTDFPPGFIYGPVSGKILISFNAQSIFVPKIDENYDPDHYNFEGTFRIVGGDGFYEGITGSGTIAGTFHDHEWNGDPDKKWFDFVMIGQARFPGS